MLTAEQLLRDMLKQMQQTLHSQASTAYDQLVNEQRAFFKQLQQSLATMSKEQGEALETLQTTQNKALEMIKDIYIEELEEEAKEVRYLGKQVSDLIELFQEQSLLVKILNEQIAQLKQ